MLHVQVPRAAAEEKSLMLDCCRIADAVEAAAGTTTLNMKILLLDGAAAAATKVPDWALKLKAVVP